MSEKKRPLTEVITGIGPGIPANVMEEYGDFKGAKREPLPNALVQLPFLAILQKGSPQINVEKNNYISGARAGMFMNTATQEVYEGKERGLEILLCWQDYYFAEWTPKDQGGGFHGTYPDGHPLIQQLIREQVPEYRGRGVFKKLLYQGHEIIETVQLALLYAPYTGEPIVAEMARPALMLCSSTKMTPVKRFINRALSLQYGDITPPQFAHRWRVTTIYEEREAGDSYNLKFDLCAKDNTMEALIPRRGALFAMAEAFQRAVKVGEAKGDYERAEGAHDDDIPF